jgi:hypothetical protein
MAKRKMDTEQGKSSTNWNIWRQLETPNTSCKLSLPLTIPNPKDTDGLPMKLVQTAVKSSTCLAQNSREADEVDPAASHQ